MEEYVKIIFKAFCSMDIKTLHNSLKDYHYQNATKESFLRQLGKAFQNFYDADDTSLVAYKGQCNNSQCENFGKSGYRFVGNSSNRYINLIFEIEDGDIKNIFHCGHLKTYEEAGKMSYELKIKIPEDEKITFVKTPEYVVKLNAATKAWDEIVKTPPRTINFSELCDWVDKHAASFEMFDVRKYYKSPMKWSPFLFIYPPLQDIKEFLLENIEKIREFNLLIDKIQNEEDLLEWLIKSEEIGSSAPNDLKFSLKKRDDYYRWNYYNPIYLKDSVFTEAKNFIDYYQENYDEMFEKYTIYTSLEMSLLYNFSYWHAELRDIYSLKFHLENRRQKQSVGVDIPLYVDRLS